MEGFCFASPFPQEILILAYFASKILPFKSPSPLEFPLTFHGVGMDFSWNYTLL